MTTNTDRHYILFTGHMIDKPGRKAPRFPPDKEETARVAIKENIKKVLQQINSPVTGIAGGACGGDILFHEVCAELNIPAQLLLTLPKEEFIQESVGFAGDDWMRRFEYIYKNVPVYLLHDASLPEEIAAIESVWERSNRWMLHTAFQNGGDHMTLMALWNQQDGDDTGGTAHMVKAAREQGAGIIIINTEELFSLHSER